MVKKGKSKSNGDAPDAHLSPPGPHTLGNFIDFPTLGRADKSGTSNSLPSEYPVLGGNPPRTCDPSDRTVPLWGCREGSGLHASAAPNEVNGTGSVTMGVQRPQCSAPTAPKVECPYKVNGSKKGGFPIQIETRKCGKKVTVIRNVSGDVQALLKDIKQAVGAGGVLRENDVEVQGEHVPRIETMLAKKGCLKGVSSQNIQAAQPQKKQDKPSSKSIAKLDQKAQALKQKK